MTLFWRAWATIMLVNLVVLALFVGLATLRYAGIEGGLTGERLGVLAERTAEPFTIAAGLGLSLGQVRNAPAVLERSRRTDALIEAIHVFAPDGRVVHSSLPEAPARVGQEVIRRHRASAGTPWYLESGDRFISGVSIDGATGVSSGGVLLARYSAPPQPGPRPCHVGRAVDAAGAAFGLAHRRRGGLACRCVGPWPGRPRDADRRRLEQTIDAFERRCWRPGGVALAPGKGGRLRRKNWPSCSMPPNGVTRMPAGCFRHPHKEGRGEDGPLGAPSPAAPRAGGGRGGPRDRGGPPERDGPAGLRSGRGARVERAHPAGGQPPAGRSAAGAGAGRPAGGDHRTGAAHPGGAGQVRGDRAHRHPGAGRRGAG